MTDEPIFEDPNAVFADYPTARSFEASADGRGPVLRRLRVTVEGEVADNFAYSEEQFRQLMAALFHIVGGQDTALGDIQVGIDGEPDEGAVEESAAEYVRRKEAIMTEYQKRSDTAAAVINEAKRRGQDSSGAN